MMRIAVIATIFLAAGAALIAQAPTRIERNALVFVGDTEFGQALSAAVLKKKVPVLLTTVREKATFFMEETTTDTREGTAERVTKVLAFGAFAGNGRTFEANVRLTNADGTVLFARSARKNNVRSAAEDVAERLKDHIEDQPRANR